MGRRERFPIRPMFGPSLPIEAERSEKVKEVAEQTAQEVFEKRMIHEIERAMATGKLRFEMDVF
jgi:hypothetical protein